MTPGAFCQKRIFWTFWRFSGWTWAKLAPIYSKRHLQHDSIPFFPPASRFTTFLHGHAQKSKFWGRESDLRLQACRFFILFYLFFYFAFPLSPFFFLLQWLIFYWACFQFKKFWESIIETGNFYHGVATCSHKKFCSEFFTQLVEHFSAYFRLHWTDYSDLGITGKIFSSCRSWA